MHAVAYGAQVGLTAEQLQPRRRRTRATPPEPARAAARPGGRRAARDEHDLDALHDELARELAPDQLLELLVLAGWYRLIAYVANGARVEAEPWAAPFPA